MLESLTIRHIALIDEVTIHFHQGMQALTGETGAGKSIVVDAVNLILGGRADRELIRTGCEKASVEAVFDANGNSSVQAFMDHEGIEYDGRTVTIYREMTTSGKNLCRICGVLFPLSRLKDLAGWLLDLHGQNEHSFLTDPDMQLSFLDQTGDETHQELLARIRRDCEAFLNNHRHYVRLVKKNENRETHMLSLYRDLEELKKAGVERGEAEKLQEERKRLTDIQTKAESLYAIRAYLSGDEEGQSALSKIKAAYETMKVLSSHDDAIRNLCDRSETLYYELEEVAYQISVMTDRNGYDSDMLETIDKRLELIHRLEKKYSICADELPELVQSMEDEYRMLGELEEEVKRMSAEHKKTLSIYRSTARELSASRYRLAASFEQKLMKELNELGMGNTHFSVVFIPNESGRPIMPSPQGDDRIEFMISPNPGEPLKSMAKIASGGELSRIMLAVKTLESAHNGVESMVFDEIDTGISGRMAQVVAEKMIAISRERQVICVTHLPQIAAASDFQYLVQKAVEGKRTLTSVAELDREGRIAEVGRMISGADGITEEANAYAERLLNAADSMKKGKGH